jgi:type IX secretion system PorP/SprF family membrane protein
MKKLLLAILSLVGTLAYGQQDPHFTMYMMNPFVLNPALAGTAEYYQIRLNDRLQYLNFKDAPITNSFSAYGPSVSRPMGWGGTLYNDITGPTSRTGITGVYAYHIDYKGVKISGGLGLGLIQYKIDGSNMTSHDISDPALQGQVKSLFVPDASTGIYVWGSNFYGGFSVQHILNSHLRISSTDNGEAASNLKPHFYLVGGYKRDLSTGRKKKVWVIEPSLILKKTIPTNWQLESNVKVTYSEMVMGGLSFRTQDALSLVLGYTYNKQLFFAYSYDLILTDIRQYSIGSHEIVIGYNFSKITILGMNKNKKKK